MPHWPGNLLTNPPLYPAALLQRAVRSRGAVQVKAVASVEQSAAAAKVGSSAQWRRQ